jgi:hypothetical protein
MAAQKPKKAKSPAQVKADQKFAAAGRSAQAAARAASKAAGKPAPRTKAQKAATKKWAAAGAQASHAAAVARRAGKTYAPKKAVKAPLNLQRNLDTEIIVPTEPGLSLHLLPVCGPAALAAHLLLTAGIAVPDENILMLHDLVRDASLADLLEYAAMEGFAGTCLESARPCDPSAVIPGLLYGVQLDGGYHAVVAVPGGMISWGGIWPLAGIPEEAWHLEWRT